MFLLYYLPTCPFCQKVLDFLKEHDDKLKITLKSISEEENLSELMEKGGKRQVPFLIDTDEDFALYESDDIIEYLRKRL